MLRRQCGVPALSSRPALAISGTTHCTKSAKVTRDELSRGSAKDAAAYVATIKSHRDRNTQSEREDDMLVLVSSLGGKRAVGVYVWSSDGLRITKYEF